MHATPIRSRMSEVDAGSNLPLAVVQRRMSGPASFSKPRSPGTVAQWHASGNLRQ